MSIFCAARNCPTDSPNSLYAYGNRLKAGRFVTIACAGSSRHTYPESYYCHLACASPISSSLLHTGMDAILTEVDDDRRLVSNSETIIYQLYYCGDPLCLGEVLEQEGHDLAKRIIRMASQDTVSARAMANESPFDQLAKNQLIVAVDALRSAPVARATSSPEMVVDPSKPFDPLVECGVLTAAQADQLEYRGVRTREDLVQRVQSGTRRRALSLETGVSEDSLLAAGVVAHAISSMPSDSREGIRLVAQMEFSAPESEDDRLFYEWLVEQEHATVQELMADVFQDSIDDTIARSDIFKTSRIIGGFVAFVLIGLLALVVDMWSRLFPAPASNAAQSVLNVLLRERALTTLASFSLLMLSIVGFLAVQALGGDAVKIIEKRLVRRLVRPVDFLSLAQVGSTASPRFQNLVQWLRTHTTWVALGVFALSLMLTWLLSGQASYAQWMGYSIGVCIVVGSLLAVTLQIVLFRQRSQHLEGLAEAKKRYASSLVFRALFDTTWIFVLYLIFAPWGLRVMESFAVDWQTHQEQRQVATFEQNLAGFKPNSGDEAIWEAERSEQVARIRESIDERLDSMREAWQVLQEFLAQMGLPIGIAAIGSLLVVALIEFVYVTRPKGILTLCVFFLVLLAAEFLPDRVTQLLGAAPGSKMWIFLSLVVAIVISIIGEFGTVSVEHGERQT